MCSRANDDKGACSMICIRSLSFTYLPQQAYIQSLKVKRQLTWAFIENVEKTLAFPS